MKRLTSFIHKNRLEFVAIIVITLVALVFRLYRIGDYLTFLGDEGRDVRIVRDLLAGNLVFIGPQTSIGNMYLGPLYYYMMAPALWLSGLDPVGPAIMVALLSTVTVVFTWWVGRVWFSPLAGVVAALLFTISPTAVIYARSSWNPNPIPFFALLSIWGIWQVWRNRRWFWLPISAVSLAFALQMHYLGLLLIPTLVIFWYLSLRQTKNKKAALWPTLLSLFLFLLLMSPLVLFDLKHQGINFAAFKAFFTTRQTTVNLNPARSDRFLPVLYQIVDELLLATTSTHQIIVSLVLTFLALFAFLKSSKKSPFILLLTWLSLALLGLGVYKQHVYAHYFGFIFPAVFLLVGALFAWFWQNGLTRILATAFLAWLVFVNLTHSPFQNQPNRLLARTQKIVDLVINQSASQEFNLGLIAERNYDESYRYFLENQNAPLVRGEDKVSDQLFVICEKQAPDCQPLGHPEYQIAIFGIAQIEQKWELEGVTIFRLTHPD